MLELSTEPPAAASGSTASWALKMFTNLEKLTSVEAEQPI